MNESWAQQALWFVGPQDPEARAVPVLQDGALAEQMKSPSPVLHYAEGTGKISAPLAEQGHDSQSPWAWAFRWAWSRAIGAGRGPQIVCLSRLWGDSEPIVWHRCAMYFVAVPVQGDSTVL